MFVGRKAELHELCRALDESLRGSGRLYLVYGEPGIGKTRLCDELGSRAAALSVPLFWGRCWEAGGAAAYWPWLDVLSALCARLDPEALSSALGEGRAALASILPALRGTQNAQPSDRPSEARLQLFRAVSGLLRRVAAERGLVLVLEDLHAADESSLLLLHFVSRELRSMRVFLLVTFRDVEARLSAAVGEAIGRLTREGTSLSLGRLTESAAEQLVLERASGLDRAAAAVLFTRTQGNPLFLQELTALWVSNRAALSSGNLPASVREVLRERLTLVPEAAGALLEAAAIGGDDIDPSLLAAALGQDLSSVLAGLAQAEQAGVIVARPHDRYAFFHALVREVLAQDLRPAVRQRLHACIARALEQRGALQIRHEELAHHWLQAGPEALAHAVQSATRAADQALARFAFEDAIAVLERARAAVDRSPNDWSLRAEVLLALGQAQIHGAAGAAGQALCLESAALARTHGDAELLARAALAYGVEIKAALIDPVLIGLLKEALDALPDRDSPLRVRVMARLGAAMQPHHDLLYPIGLAEAAIAAARRIGEPATLLYALHTGMSAMMDIVDPRVRLPLNLESEQLAEALGDHERMLRSLVRLVFDHLELGELATADARIAHFERLTHETRAARYAWRVPLFHSMRALMHGRFTESEGLLERAHELGTQAEDPQLARCYAFHREGLLRAWERHADMVAYDLSVRPLRAAFYSGRHWQNGGSAFTHSRVEAIEQTRLYLQLIPEDDWPLVHNPPAFMHLGEPLALCGDASSVRRVYELLLPAAARCVSWGFTKFIWDGTAARVLGLLAARAERYDEACEHFEAAIALSERLQTTPYLARTRYEYARSLLQLARPNDRERALRLLELAKASAEALDMRGLVHLAERQLASVGGGATSASTRNVAIPTQVSHTTTQHVAPPLASDSTSRNPAQFQPAAAVPAQPSRDAATLPDVAQVQHAVVDSAQPSPHAATLPDVAFTLIAEGEFWTIQHAAGSLRLRDSLGLHYLARLFAEPNRPIHVLELSSADPSADSRVLGTSDAGELLDDRAVQTYRKRALELEEELAEAERFQDVARSERARAELEFLGTELSRAVGLGGRPRRASSASERARSAVQRRIRNVLERVRKTAPELAELWEKTLTTGTYCVFRPAPGPGNEPFRATSRPPS
jgi:tetratricopeptide (TPR) repeat protein